MIDATKLEAKNKSGKALRFFKRHFGKKQIVRVFMYVFLLDMVFVFLYPFIYMLVTSLKSPQDLLDASVNWLLNDIHINNYKLAWEHMQYPITFVRTFLVVALSTFGHLLSCSFIAYGFARFKFKGQNVMFLILLLSIIVPPQTIITPLYMIFTKIKINNTYLPIILPTFFGYGLKGGLFIFIFRQFYLSLPRSLEEAAAIDGCGPIKTFAKIALPSSRSSIMVSLVLSMVWHWNDYFEPTVYLRKSELYLLPQKLSELYNIMKGVGVELTEMANLDQIYTSAVALAATTLVILPVFIIYMLLQKQFIQGVERSGITGE